MYRTIRTGDITFHLHQVTHVKMWFDDNDETKKYKEHLAKIDTIRRDHEFRLNLHPFGISKESMQEYIEDRDRKIAALGEMPKPAELPKVTKYEVTLACGKSFDMMYNPLEGEDAEV